MNLQSLQAKIKIVRGQRVMFDQELASIYGVTVKRLNEQVKRNASRFPSDFMFQLTEEEAETLRSQFATLDKGRGKFRKYAPYAFTEQGIAMLSSVLHSERAIQANIAIMRTFVAMRQWVLNYEQLQRRLEEMEQRYEGHFKLLFRALRQVLKEEAKPKTRIGFS